MRASGAVAQVTLPGPKDPGVEAWRADARLGRVRVGQRDDGAPTVVDLSRGALVVTGPSGSGKSVLLGLVAHTVLSAGGGVDLWVADALGHGLDHLGGCARTKFAEGPGHAAQFLVTAAGRIADARARLGWDGTERVVVVVDGADSLIVSGGARLRAALQTVAEAGPGVGVHLALSARPGPLVSAVLRTGGVQVDLDQWPSRQATLESPGLTREVFTVVNDVALLHPEPDAYCV